MKIIFLDIDGVLNSADYYKKVAKKGKDWNRFNPLAVEIIKRLVVEFNSEIVITSSWRFGAVKELKNELIKSGLIKHLHKDWKTPVIHPSSQSRGNEIRTWLENHKQVDNYIIIDDDDNILNEQMGNFIKTDINEGITEKHYYSARDIFSKIQK